jgi:hypothetical protein
MDKAIEALFVERALILQKWNQDVMNVKVNYDTKEMYRMEATSHFFVGAKNAC